MQRSDCLSAQALVALLLHGCDMPLPTRQTNATRRTPVLITATAQPGKEPRVFVASVEAETL
ncbi:hypothetical protein IQ22_02830 [Pseudomonas duriflava]|uniref:Uncharacterized protein n=1 Tax=Pseudomonas duriflava TaxID=459528 RepID=A0A562Q8H5_9PSED|nr:hypothetical protein [Pseudomonas duriflava]TWI52994.1 hypothetical protein IQ22_02830 [Pseudomonas duriflava]